MVSLLSVAAVHFLFLATAVAAAQSTIDVPGDEPTIQAGIVRAVDGDTVLVAPGTYFENIDFLGKAITVASSAGAAVTTIDGGGNAPTVTFHNQEGSDSVLRGFGITGGFGFAFGGGITARPTSGAAATPLVQECDIFGNDGGAAFQGGGVGGDPILEDCTIRENNRAPLRNIGGGGVWGSPTLRRCLVLGNGAIEGGGLALGSGSLVEDCLVIGNLAIDGANGGGIYVWGSQVTVRRTLIAGNTADAFGFVASRGGGVHVALGVANVAFERCTVADNLATPSRFGFDGTGGVFGPAAYVDSIVYDNQGTQHDGGAAFTFSDVQGGAAGAGNIDQDPLFANAAGGDYTLQAVSPCIDAGDPTSPQDPDCTRADMGAFAFQQAGTFAFNGNGINPSCLQSLTPPILGTIWMPAVTAGPGASFSGVFVFAQPLGNPLPLGAGELLVDPSSKLLAVAIRVSTGGLDVFGFPLPANPALAGLVGNAQGFVVGAVLQPCNALEVKLGF